MVMTMGAILHHKILLYYLVSNCAGAVHDKTFEPLTKYLFIVSPKNGDTMDHAASSSASSSASAEISCDRPTGHISFRSFFKFGRGFLMAKVSTPIFFGRPRVKIAP